MRKFSQLVFLTAMLLVANALADELSLTLAKLPEGELSLQNLIEFPDVGGDVSAAVYCRAEILGSGGISWTNCFESDSVDQAFVDAIETAGNGAKGTAASVDGKKYAMYLFFRVVFVRQDGESFIGVYPNWGHDIDKYGLDYKAPQRYSRAIWPTNCRLLSGTFRAFSTLLIGADGVAKGDVSFDRSDEDMKDQDCVKSLASLLESSKYIPGEYDGAPVDVTIVESWGNMEDMVVE